MFFLSFFFAFFQNYLLFFYFFVFIFFFSKLSLSILFFYYWTGWEFSFITFFCFFSLKHCWLLQYFPTWFLFYYSVFPHVFFHKIIFVKFIFFNIEMVKNLAS
jgi:hypothetical protein